MLSDLIDSVANPFLNENSKPVRYPLQNELLLEIFFFLFHYFSRVYGSVLLRIYLSRTSVSLLKNYGPLAQYRKISSPRDSLLNSRSDSKHLKVSCIDKKLLFIPVRALLLSVYIISSFVNRESSKDRYSYILIYLPRFDVSRVPLPECTIGFRINHHRLP